MNFNYDLRLLVKKFTDVPFLSRYLILSGDVFLLVFSSIFTYYFLSILTHLSIDIVRFRDLIIFSICASLFWITIFSTYKHIIRHTTVGELMNIEYAVFAKSLTVVTLYYFLTKEMNDFLLAFLIMDFILSSFLLIIVRALITFVYYKIISIDKHESGIHVCIFSISEGAISLINYLSNSKSKYVPVGFITRKPDSSGMRITGLPVFSYDRDNIEEVLKSLNIRNILFTNIKDLNSDQDLVKVCINCNIHLQVAPIIEESRSDICKFRIHEIKVESLLGRSEINLNNIEYLKEFFANKSIFITGAAGSIGSELCRQLAILPIKKLILFDNAETPMHNIILELTERFPSLDLCPIIGDTRNILKVETQLAFYRPEIIFHAAAYKHVPLMEKDPCESIIVNVGGTCNMAEMAVKYNVEKFIMISTDKAVNPSSVMGASKRIAEMYVQSLSRSIKNGSIKGRTRFITTRFGNVLGSNGSVIPLFRSQLIKGGPLTVTHPNIIRYFMTIPEACRLVMEAASMGQGEEIFAFDMGKPVKIDNLARQMIEQAGLLPDIDIKIKYTGLRPGEKLYEEVLADKENTRPTTNAKIWIANTREYLYNEVKNKVGKLLTSAFEGDKYETVKNMKELIPEYKSLNSVYATLDK